MQARRNRDLQDQTADANVFRVGLESKGKGDVSEKESSSDFLATFLTEIGKAKLLTREEEIELSRRVKKSVELQNLRARVSEELGREATHSEWAKAQGCSVYSLRRKLREGELARHKLLATNLRLVVSVAKKYLRCGVELSDLVAAGTMGLSKGVEKFDPNRGYKLSTYVHWWIRQAVTRAVADHSRTIRLPVHVHETLGRLRRAKAQLASEGELANVKNLANTLGLSERKIDNVLKLKYKTRSMNEEVSPNNRMEEGSTMDNFIADPDAETRPWKELEADFLQANVKNVLLDQLDPRERDIIRLRFGFGRTDGRTMTLDVISQRYGVSRERIRQLETVAVRKLKLLSQGKELHSCALLLRELVEMCYANHPQLPGPRSLRPSLRILFRSPSTSLPVSPFLTIPPSPPSPSPLIPPPAVRPSVDARRGGSATLFLPLSGFRVLADAVGYDYPHFNRILKYHLIPDARYTLADLKALREDSLLPTAEGSKLKVFSSRGSKIVWLQGRSIIPAAVTIPNLFVGERIIVHGLSQRLIPPSF
ncbi:unnamed protein product [Closterium sp. NIES-65]|nr:unnamed protein product [Closterium sp. NIES-65]CAI6003658.1 unnamed protein product [Closterium sp. NIES-65]